MIRSLNINIENADDSDKVNLIHNVNYLFVTKTLYIFRFQRSSKPILVDNNNKISMLVYEKDLIPSPHFLHRYCHHLIQIVN